MGMAYFYRFPKNFKEGYNENKVSDTALLGTCRICCVEINSSYKLV